MIEYGSGMSSFFFALMANNCYSFEEDADPAGKGSWSEEMTNQSRHLDCPIKLITPCYDNDTPKRVVNELWKQEGRLLVSIGGGERSRHFKEWGDYIIERQGNPIVILIDNSEISDFSETFNLLADRGAAIYHHYGNVYGQLTTKQCTSFATFRPALMHSSRGAAPFNHDKRWGKMNMQHT